MVLWSKGRFGTANRKASQDAIGPAALETEADSFSRLLTLGYWANHARDFSGVPWGAGRSNFDKRSPPLLAKILAGRGKRTGYRRGMSGKRRGFGRAEPKIGDFR